MDREYNQIFNLIKFTANFSEYAGMNSLDKQSPDYILESELNARIKKHEKKEEDLNIEISDMIKKHKLIRDKEESLKDIELDLNKRERSMDRLLLESEKDIDIKHQEMNKKLDNKIKEIDNREKELNDREKSHNSKINQKDFDREKYTKILFDLEKMLNIFSSNTNWAQLPTNAKMSFDEIRFMISNKRGEL